MPECLDHWAALKGIKVIGTGDFTHPGWLKELREKLEPAEQGLFRLKDEYKLDTAPLAPGAGDNEIRFLLTAEISSIYKKTGQIRKVHNVIFAPDFKTAEKIQRALTGIGANITSDGRPILGLDSRDLLEIALNSSDKIFFVPAHVWTPWFSALGSKSGFDSVAECFGDLASHIFAVETGLSSNAPMNWICGFLDNYTLISNSDAHSPEKLGRNANIFDTELSYDAIIQAMKTGDPGHFLGTIDLFPQQGKYHYDGHRKCGICWDPLETLRNNEVCPVCGQKVTVGVMNRVVQLSDREDPTGRKNRLPFVSIIPLKEILAEIAEVGPASKRVSRMYDSLLRKTGPELNILLDMPVEKIKETGDGALSEAIRRMRDNDILIKEGFDGEYGRIKVFREKEAGSFGAGGSLFDEPALPGHSRRQRRKMINFDLEEYRRLKGLRGRETSAADIHKTEPPVSPGSGADQFNAAGPFKGLNPEQKKAAAHVSGPALIIAGPGTGKTRTLTCRIAALVRNRGIDPGSILAVTFTNKAANEMKERLKTLLDDKTVISRLHVSTFHAFGFSILKRYIEKTGRNERSFIIDENDKRRILQEKAGCAKNRLKDVSAAITSAKQNLRSADEIEDSGLAEIFNRYQEILKQQNAFDLDGLIYHPVRLFDLYPEILASCRKQYQWVLVDEYQDINFAQYRMISRLMPGPDPNLYAIGDPNQAIYGFRGADVKFIGKFIDDHPRAAVYKLNECYRCSGRILKASNGVIQSGAPGGPSKGSLLKGLQEGVKIKVAGNSSDRSEAEFIARTIEKMAGGLRFFSMDSQITEGNETPEIKSLSDFAVLCRINRQMEALEKAFNDHGIPFQKIEDSPFFRREPVKHIINMLKSSMDPANGSVRDRIAAVIDGHFGGKSADEKENDRAPLKKLLDLADDFGNDMEAFLRFTALGTGVDTYKPNTESVALMTLHAAKGLEFECVFIAGCENGLLPYSLFRRTAADPEEERRLFYVGMTRAKKFLFLSHAEKRFILGKEYRLGKSPYLDNIEKELIEPAKSGHRKKDRKKDAQLSLFDTA